jgi:hypothetical protein
MQAEDQACGVACIAMVAGVKYGIAEIVSNTVAENWPERGMGVKSVIAALTYFGQTWTYRRCGYPRRLLRDAV